MNRVDYARTASSSRVSFRCTGKFFYRPERLLTEFIIFFILFIKGDQGRAKKLSFTRNLRFYFEHVKKFEGTVRCRDKGPFFIREKSFTATMMGGGGCWRKILIEFSERRGLFCILNLSRRGQSYTWIKTFLMKVKLSKVYWVLSFRSSALIWLIH